MKNVILFFALNLTLFNAPSTKTNEITAEAIVAAIAKKDYELINATFDKDCLIQMKNLTGNPY